jgi:hypothetical protein
MADEPLGAAVDPTIPPHQKITFNVTVRAVAAVAATAQRLGVSKTDVLNRAAILYDKVTEMEAQGGIIHVQMPGGSTYRLMLV